jgi:probable O-glycosylation ligase (exosortase A-associated)
VRDLVLLAGLAALLPLLVRNPFAGVLAWIWISLMNPQREVYGLLAGFELNLYVAVLTALVWLCSRERKTPPADGFVVLLALFALWTCVSTYLALDRPFAMPLWSRNIKTMVLVLAVASLAQTRVRIQAVLWMAVVAIGFYAVKGAGFVVLTGGRHHVLGPEDTMIADNNALGLAFVVFLPLMAYLLATSRRPLARLAAAAAMLLTVLATLGTYSRGALVALLAMAVFHALRSRTGLVLLAAGAILAAALPAVAPSGWVQRMASIRTYDRDQSFQGRVAAWRTSVNIAAARPLVGGGFSAVERDHIVKRFRTDGSLAFGKAAHSIYFEVLGDTGLVGLLLYLGALAAAGWNTVLVLRLARGRPEFEWAGKLARALQTSLVAMLVGGAALSMAYYDGFLVLLALGTGLVFALRREDARASLAGAGAPAWAAPSAAPSATKASRPDAPRGAEILSFGRVGPPLPS